MNLLLTSGIFYPEIGGPSSYLRELIKYLINERKVKVTIITYGNIKSNYRIYLTKNIELIKINRNKNKILRFFITTYLIFKKLKRKNFFYANGLFFEVGIVSIIKNKKFICKIVGDYHWERFYRYGYTNSSIEEFNKKKYIFLINIIRKFTFINCKRIIVPSNYLKEIVSSWGIKKEYSIINNFVSNIEYNKYTDIKEFDEILKNNNNKKIVLTVSRLVKHKNIDFLVKNLLYNDYIFVIIGFGPEYKNIKNLIEKNKLNKKVYLLKDLEKSQIYKIMSKSDIFLLHSSYEGFPHVVIEAMANNLICLLSNVGGNSEIIKNDYNGYLLELFDAKKLNSKIDFVINNNNNSNNLNTILNNAKLTLKKFNKRKLLIKTFNALS